MATSNYDTVEEYLYSLNDERREVVHKIRQIFQKKLPKGFEEVISYGMIGYVVPHELYPKGYHCDPKLPLPFINIASQKNFIAIYHMGIYANPDLLNWFVSEFPKHCTTKLDMGKSCIRFKKMDQIPYDLLTQLAIKMTPQDWILLYESQFKKK